MVAPNMASPALLQTPFFSWRGVNQERAEGQGNLVIWVAPWNLLPHDKETLTLGMPTMCHQKKFRFTPQKMC